MHQRACFLKLIIESANLNNLNVYGYLLHLLAELPKLGDNPDPEQLDSFKPRAKLPDFCKYYSSSAFYDRG